MFFILQALFFLAGFLRPAVTSVKGAPDPLGGIEQAGAMVPNGAMVQALSAFSANAAPAFGNFNFTLIPQNVAARTYTGAEMVQTIIKRFAPAQGTLVDCTDTATNIVAAIPGAKPLQTWLTIVANMGSTALTVAAGAGVSIAGTALVQSMSARIFVGQVTGSAAVTFTNAFGFPLGSQSSLTAAQ
jgi:hypothetical protein